MTEIESWRVTGSYYESCNCPAVCPCRRMNGVPGGRSTYGICQFVLSWRILGGTAAGIDLSNLHVSMAGFYDNDETGAPWKVILDRKSTRLNSSHIQKSRMPSSA